MGWWSKVRNRLTRWSKAIHLGNTIEALIKGDNLWKAFWKDKSIIYGEVFRLIDDFHPSYETFYGNQTVGIFEEPFKCSTLTSISAGSTLLNRDLQDLLRESSLNSLTARANAYSKKSSKSSFYKEFNGAVYYTSPDESYTDSLMSDIFNLPLYEEGMENQDIEYLVPDTLVYTKPEYDSIALDYLYRTQGYISGDYIYNNNSYKIIGASVSEDRESIFLECVNNKYLDSTGSYTNYTVTKIPLPIKTYEGMYGKIPYIIGKGTGSIVDSEYWIPIESDECPTQLKNHFKNQGKVHSEYLMPLRLRSEGKAIQQDSDEFKENEKLFKVFGIDYVDIARCINADVSILTRRKYDDKNQQEADTNYVANLEKVTNSFLFFGLELSEEHKYANEYFFKYFKWLEDVNHTGVEELNYKEYGYKLTFNSIEATTEKNASLTDYPEKYGKKLIKEEIVSVESYQEPNPHGAPITKYRTVTKTVDSLLLWHWVDSKNIEKIVVSNLKAYNSNGGWRETSLADGLNAKTDDDSGNFYIPINMIPLRKVGAIKGSDILKASIRVLYNSSTKIRKKWYSTTWFTVVRIIASIVVIVSTWGSGTPYVLAANAALNVALNIAIQILIAIAVKLAAKYICKIFNIPEEYTALVALTIQLAIAWGMSTGGESGTTSSLADSSSSVQDAVIKFGSKQVTYATQALSESLGTATSSGLIQNSVTAVKFGMQAWNSYNQEQYNKKVSKINSEKNSLNADLETLYDLKKEIDNYRCKIDNSIIKQGTNFTDIIIDNSNSYVKVSDIDVLLANIHSFSTVSLSKGRILQRNSPILQASYFNS